MLKLKELPFPIGQVKQRHTIFKLMLVYGGNEKQG
jgi:hypothetical protein